MKMFRVSFAAILGVVASTTTDAPPATPTESPLAVAERARDSALEHANQTLHTVIDAAHVSRLASEDTDLIDQEVATVETAVPNTTHHYLRERLHQIHEFQHFKKREVRELVDDAKASANAYKHAARVLEAARRHAGLHESVYEGGFDHDEGQSEGWHDEAENYGDAADNYIEAFFDAVEGKLEEHAEHGQEEGDFDEHDDQDNDRGNHDNHEHNRGNDDNNRGNHDSDAAAAEPASASNATDAQQDDDATSAPATDDQQDVASSAVSLRAVAQNPGNAGQGFLLTFACIGFLASMAFAVQMQSRRTRSQAKEPLLLVHD